MQCYSAVQCSEKGLSRSDCDGVRWMPGITEPRKHHHHHLLLDHHIGGLLWLQCKRTLIDHFSCWPFLPAVWSVKCHGSRSRAPAQGFMGPAFLALTIFTPVVSAGSTVQDIFSRCYDQPIYSASGVLFGDYILWTRFKYVSDSETSAEVLQLSF